MGLRNLFFWPVFIFFQLEVEAVPPEACFADFRWDDCGQSPIPVMYYWKPGSRCEVGLWRGCLPNLNMFQDEYECVTTCIFTARAIPDDYHSMHENEIETDTENTTESVTEVASTTDVTGGNVTTVANGGATSVSSAATGGSGNGTNTTAAVEKATSGAAGGGAAATTHAA